MKSFVDVEKLVIHMFDNARGNEYPVSVIADKEITVKIMSELLAYEDVILDTCDIDDFEYDREYIITLRDEIGTDEWHFEVMRDHLDDVDKYLATDGYVLIHENVNSKCKIDIENNAYGDIVELDWFTFDEYDNFESDYDEEVENDAEDSNADSTVSTISVKCNIDPCDVVSMVHMYEMFDEMNRFRRLFRW